MREFVMGDIHGSFKALKQCLTRSKFDYRNDRLIQLGDVTDRHGDVYECVEELLKIKNLIALRGNHDDWMDEFIQTGYHPANWLQGGLETVKSYLSQANVKSISAFNHYELKALIKPEDIPKRHRDFFTNMQLYYIDEHGRCFVHGGFNRFLSFTSQSPSIYYWDRELWLSAMEWQVNEKLHPGQETFEMKTRFKEIFIGHTPTTEWNTTVPMNGANVYNLDTGAGQVGKLTIKEVTTKKFWQSDPMSELYSKGPILA
jgi:serine/threonine protein phosphatase 1